MDDEVEAGEVDADVELPGFDGRAIGAALAWALAREEAAQVQSVAELRYCSDDGSVEGDIDPTDPTDPADVEASE